MYEQQLFKALYLRLVHPDVTQEKAPAIKMLQLLGNAVFIEAADWDRQALTLVPFNMEGRDLEALEFSNFAVDISSVPYLQPFDRLEFFLPKPDDPLTQPVHVAYKLTYRGRVNKDWLDLERLRPTVIHNIRARVLMQCPGPYQALHTKLKREMQDLGPDFWERSA
jgi:hypothetical protein